jgi:hypothetical protein
MVPAELTKGGAMSVRNAVIPLVLALAVSACQKVNDATSLSPTSPSATIDVPAAAALAGSRQGLAKPAVADNQLLAAMRAATARFQNIDAAFAAGYVDDGFGCIDAASFGLDPTLGGMGFHLINEALHADPATDPLRPDLLVYEPQPHGHSKLVALEYEVFRPDWYGAGNTHPPTLLGQAFESIDFEGLELYGLHVWLWRNNPSGMFQDFNPKVACH